MNDKNNSAIKPIESFEIMACDELPNKSKLKKLELSSNQKASISMLHQELPSIMAAQTLANAYILNLPNGVSISDLMHYKNGQLGTPFYGEHGIAGHASLTQMRQQAVLMGAFSVMAMASGQYFLKNINNNLTVINQKADKILEFLYGDKKAELMSEVSFVNSAYQNYNSIMGYDNQRTATIISLQAARKTAVKDIEFYMSDLDSLVKSKDSNDLEQFVNKAFKIKDCLQLSVQLYCMSTILEVFYSQNFETDYITYVEKDILTYIDKCEKRLLSSFSAIEMYVINFKGHPLKKIDKSIYENRIAEYVELLGNGKEFIERKPLQSVLQSCLQNQVCYLDKDGELYLKIA